MHKKVIGISPRFWSNETQEYIRVGVQYTNQLQREDIIPIIIVDSPNLEDTLNMCDAFLIIGGDDINPEYIMKNLYQDLPMLDFVIRTSGEQRISNFMLFQASYAEFYFTDVLFPDFTPEEFDKAILAFNKRDRRYGGVK